MKTSLEQDMLQRQQEMKACELKMITLLSTFQPNQAQMYQLSQSQQYPNTPPYLQQDLVTPSPQARKENEANPHLQK